MNTNDAAKTLGISPSTVQRWAAAFNLEIERNHLGHYQFTDQNIEELRNIQQQLRSESSHEKRTGRPKKPAEQEWKTAIQEIERRLEGKADGVVSYQLLQHRREIEELQNQNKKLENRLFLIETQLEAARKDRDTQEQQIKKPGRRRIFQLLFGF